MPKRLFGVDDFDFRRIRVAGTHQHGAGDVGDVADLGDGGDAGAGIGAKFLKAVESHGIEGNRIGGGEQDAGRGGVTGVEFTASGKFDDEAVGNMQDGFGFDGIAGEDFPDGGVLIRVGLDQPSGVVDAAKGEGGAATVDAEIGITGHGAEIDQLGRLSGEDLGEVGPVGDFVGGFGEIGGGHAVHQGGLELEIPVNELAHGGVEVGGGIGIPAEAGNVGARPGLDRPNLDLPRLLAQGVTRKNHVFFLFVPKSDLFRF